MDLPTGTEAWAVGSRVTKSIVVHDAPKTKANQLPDVPAPDDAPED